MKPIEFEEQNAIFAENQKPYLPLPAFRNKQVVVSCWKMNWKERLRALFLGKVWVSQNNFSKPLQPLFVTVDYPFLPLKKDESFLKAT